MGQRGIFHIGARQWTFRGIEPLQALVNRAGVEGCLHQRPGGRVLLRANDCNEYRWLGVLGFGELHRSGEPRDRDFPGRKIAHGPRSRLLVALVTGVLREQVREARKLRTA